MVEIPVSVSCISCSCGLWHLLVDLPWHDGEVRTILKCEVKRELRQEERHQLVQ